MSELAFIEEAVVGLLDSQPPGSAFDEQVWSRLEESGFSLIGIDGDKGGSGATLVEAAVVLRAAARSASMMPLAETALLGGWLFAEAQQEIPAGPLTACVLEGGGLVVSDEGYEVAGQARAVPWARYASRIAVLVDGAVVRVDPAHATLQRGVNLAGEPRDDLVFERVPVREEDVTKGVGIEASALARRGALARAVGIVGAAEAAASLTFELVGNREQFGRSLSSFQAVQQMVATMAAELAATAAAVELAVESETPIHVAAAKIQAGRGATVIASLAHQLHGAVGMTHECLLHHFTRRLWAWRDEFGSETVWAARLGTAVGEVGADGLWELMTENPSDA